MSNTAHNIRSAVSCCVCVCVCVVVLRCVVGCLEEEEDTIRITMTRLSRKTSSHNNSSAI
jgi:hypothetical protein